MGRLKHTKNELKAQREALARYERFLPMLQLKKQQLQAEILAISAQIARNETRARSRRAEFSRWVKLLCEPAALETLVALEKVETREGNIAGLSIPVLADVAVRRPDYDLFATPTWVDEAVDALDALIRLRVEHEVLSEQRRRVAGELRITTQRVNLFEKVKIPECRENIRVIKVFLGDEQTAAVARSKIAKGHLHAAEAAAGPAWE